MNNVIFSLSPLDGHKQLSIEVTEDFHNIKITEFLYSLLQHYSYKDILTEIQNSRISVNNKTISSDYILQKGDKLLYDAPKEPEPQIDNFYDIVFEDEYLAIVNKSGNMPCHPAGKYFFNTLQQLLVKEKNFSQALFVNRIDRETSGLVIVAKTQEIASIMGQKMMNMKFEKKYLVAVEGEWTLGADFYAHGKIALVRGEVIHKKRAFFPLSYEKGSECGTVYTPTQISNNMTLLEATPLTGRPHQIRATLKALGYPVVGDKLYGVDEFIYARMCNDEMTEEDINSLRISRQALHSYQLGFHHPISHEKMFFEAPLPDDIKNLFN